MGFSTSVPTVTKGRPYPRPPVGVSLKRNDDVLLMLGRYEDLFNDPDKLPSVAQFCLTKLEKLEGDRKKAAKKFAIGKKVLDKVGQLADENGGRAMARKAKGINDEFTPGETRFLECAIKVFIRRVAEGAQFTGGPFRMITVKDFPEVRWGTNKDATECSMTYLYFLYSLSSSPNWFGLGG